ncbi:hypothetical protein PCL_02181 [Purpureocillium lilacinum]|uniref:Uncharacterized protein n=1 Tax=Purpureocillium lilacinum TaxID=33203 RepID=A0A2U3E1N5_PURLI|nr:hypothetical protein Purlil1_4637 [Purpureocillium lilacinum]PWI68412.1 hypothetical protein PCL_02181 [Purpureocillium lilacinum]
MPQRWRGQFWCWVPQPPVHHHLHHHHLALPIASPGPVTVLSCRRRPLPLSIGGSDCRSHVSRTVRQADDQQSGRARAGRHGQALARRRFAMTKRAEGGLAYHMPIWLAGCQFGSSQPRRRRMRPTKRHLVNRRSGQQRWTQFGVAKGPPSRKRQRPREYQIFLGLLLSLASH